MSANNGPKRGAVWILILSATGQVVAGAGLAVGLWQLGLLEFGRRVVFTNEFATWEVLSFFCTCVYLIVVIRFVAAPRAKKFGLMVVGVLAPILAQPCVAAFYFVQGRETQSNHEFRRS